MCNSSPQRRAHLKAFFYTGDNGDVHEVLLSDVLAEDVTVDLSAGMWFFRKGTPQEQSFEIGSGVRVPEHGKRSGPMMVCDLRNLGHMANLEMNVDLLRHGELASS